MQKTPDELIQENMGLVGHISKSWNAPYILDEDDLFQIGCIGLIKAARKFDPNLKAKFSTYAIRCIKNELITACRNAKKSQAFEAIELNDWLLPHRSRGQRSLVEDEAVTKDLIRRVTEADGGVMQMVLDGNSQEAIGAILGVTQSNVSKRLKIAKRILKEGNNAQR